MKSKKVCGASLASRLHRRARNTNQYLKQKLNVTRMLIALCLLTIEEQKYSDYADSPPPWHHSSGFVVRRWPSNEAEARSST